MKAEKAMPTIFPVVSTIIFTVVEIIAGINAVIVVGLSIIIAHIVWAGIKSEESDDD